MDKISALVGPVRVKVNFGASWPGQEEFSDRIFATPNAQDLKAQPACRNVAISHHSLALLVYESYYMTKKNHLGPNF